MGAHHPRHAAPDTGRTPPIAWLVVLPIALVTLGALVWLWPSADIRPDQEQTSLQQYDGTVTAVAGEECPEPLPDEVNGCGSAQVLLADGPGSGEETEVALPNGAGAPEVAEGDEVVLIRTDSPDGAVYTIVDHQRSTGL